ncbi:MAG: tRNA pseudouridine32 synthase/23S rRNA pseudouridine746 synthase [Candidatus Omnitrophota bacterium]|jgi:tRNA pseudouridine32 synthase/23S rRNA pseudouridine746 synthase
MSLLQKERRIDITTSNADADRRLSLDYLFGEARGQMFGVLECKDQDGAIVLLKAFSSQYNGIWDVDGWVPPLFEVDEFNATISQTDKEIKRLDAIIDDATMNDNERNKLIQKRKSISQNSMKEIHDIYRLNNFNGETKTLHEISLNKRGIATGTGDCCGPKLLNHAAKNNLRPISMAEFYLGQENKSKTKQHNEFYPSCIDKCQPILGFMLCGACDQDALQIVYSDDALVVVNKPSGLLSVPGRGPNKQMCVVSKIKDMFPNCIDYPAVHRLDMDTSGLLIMALTKESHKHLSIQFEDRKVKKHYIALLDGVIKETSGKIELPFRLDPDNRPYQIYDANNGKIGITLWERIGIEKGMTRIKFTSLTGRTHQLRVHAAHSLGLNTPIVGDKLYGNATEHGKLKLHACEITFTHPVTKIKLCFKSEALF